MDRKEILQKAQRVVLKVGSSLLTQKGKTDYKRIKKYCQFVYRLIKLKKEVVLVTSGAVAASGFGGHQTPINPISVKQILASMGQIHLMSMYSKCFKRFKLNIGQILLSEFSISNRVSYLNAKGTINAMLALGVVPIINENDSVATEELKFGDNDILGALVAGLIDADLYIILSDVAGFYSNYESKDRSFHRQIEQVTKKHLEEAGGASKVGTGGMYTKLLAAKKCGEFSIPSLITSGWEKNLYKSIFQKEAGTFFTVKTNKPKSKKKWIGSQLNNKFAIVIDRGAEKALYRRASLLPQGVTQVKGNFAVGDVCSIITLDHQVMAKGIVNFNSSDLAKIKGKDSQAVKSLLQKPGKDQVVHADNLFLLHR